MKKVITGLEVLKGEYSRFKGNVALLCHNASVDSNCKHATFIFKEVFGARFIKIFGPQHGFSTDAQDNMIETDHAIHPYFKIPVYSLYSETRVPTDEMLEDIDHLFIDLQDVGCRMYTYIYTLTLLLEKCNDKDIEILVLDRPNPINGVDIEGNILELDFESFIGRHPIPVRHGMTIGEVALMHQKYWAREKVDLKIIKMNGWEREMTFVDTYLPWLLPSPNLSRAESAFTFPGAVLFEGTNLSEGRGTTQPLEIIGHPNIEPFGFYNNHLKEAVKRSRLEGFVFRPITFLPTFHKYKDVVCGGFQIHVTDKKKIKPWRVGQLLLRELFHHLKDDFEWLKPPYEYNHKNEPIDIINGSDKLRNWVQENDAIEMLDSFENLEGYKNQLDSIKIY
ncbi:exo-beta-N-acetylmuramidase NamZ family protein [Kriegella aquimaris]|uniref:Uncharacterized conserved protein YbbC, DUF1343 family n=1 Tax=Kriegella aquimaris TaxID=192904 RepID=A0A1G9V2R4_9FLAO|nr:DUF1343 domain-containing protein [Kriegella aquimaris]SDM66418.1 Uncharacterized conserved protein YbbC, DUF1343 family [Kriegella aquimaris]